MENSYENQDIFGIFCDYNNVLKFFDSFHLFLQDSEVNRKNIDFSKFLRSLKYLDHNNFFEKDKEVIEELKHILLKIFDYLCLKYFNNILNEDFKTTIELFDTVAILIKILVSNCHQNLSFDHLFLFVSGYFSKYSFVGNYIEDDELNKERLQYVFKFVIDILKSLDYNSFSRHISNDIFIQFLNSFPFYSKHTTNVFINHIAPCIFAISDCSHKKIVLEFMWNRINSSYKSIQSYHFSLLCCFCDFTFKEQYELENFSIFDDRVWKIIQSGLKSDNSFDRKQVLYVFKIILFWLKNKHDVTLKEGTLFTFCKDTDLIIWNDLVTLFEALEEKQIHVIKPVLPKFSRILLLASKPSDTSRTDFRLHPSWITCFIRRMIFHESKFVVKQGLSIAMNINFKESQINKMQSKEFIEVLIKGFNDQNMYYRINENDKLALFLSFDKMLAFLTEYISAFETELQKVNFLRYVLKCMSSESWCGVALLHLTFALTKLSTLPSWKSEDIIKIRKIIAVSLKSHESIIRTAIEYWLMKSCILFVDWNSLTFEDIADLLFTFKSFQRHTEVWNIAAAKLKELFTAKSSNLSLHKAEEFALSSIDKLLTAHTTNQNPSETDLQKMAKLLLILADSSVISCILHEKSLNWNHLLHTITSVLVDAPKRPYMSQEKFFNVLQFCTLLIETSQRNIKNKSDDHSTTIIKCLSPTSEFIECIYQKSFIDIKVGEDIIHFKILHNALQVLSSTEHCNKLFLNLLPNFIKTYDSMPEHILSKKIIIILFYSISCGIDCGKHSNELQSNHLKELSFTLLKKIVDEQILDDLSKSVFANVEEKESWQKFTTESICKFWSVTSSQAINDASLITALMQQAQRIFDGSSKLTYTSTINCMKTLIPKLGLENLQTISVLFNSAWKACFELHGTETYRPAIKSFIDALFQPYMLNVKCFDVLNMYLDFFISLSENTIGIFYLAIKQFCDAFSLKNLSKENFKFIPVLIYALTYGPIHHKGQKILEDTIMYISEHDNYFLGELKHYNKPSIFVRVTVITYLIKNLYENSSENQKLTLALIDGLLAFEDSTRASRSSKFANSYSHRVRNRIWQTILLLQPNIRTRQENEKFFKKILELLEFENQQPSVRYLQEWLLLNILNKYRCLIEEFISVLENSFLKKPAFQVSLLSISAHLIMHDFISKNNFFKVFPILINYCMAQNFAVRLTSRLAITKLFLICKEKNVIEMFQKYDFLQDILLPQQPDNILLEKGNIYKNLIKLQEDFYFSAFDPINHFTLQTIFYELPRLSNVASEEWIKPEYFKSLLDSETMFVVPCFNTDSSLQNCVASSWTDKSTEEIIAIENDSFDYNFQRKICPSKCEDQGTDLFVNNKQRHSGLIVIASLIDKIPNLGGLCRTCEIFGIEEFVIGSLKYTEDKQFQNLSVSADKWISIKEVKPYNLKEYLRSLQEDGYTIVGAEQTDDSKKLSDFIFPKKSALLLGHEKEGMPVDLIQLLDACIEIPQQGVIRSLNVHVSGAIFIWEYARQQIK